MESQVQGPSPGSGEKFWPPLLIVAAGVLAFSTSFWGTFVLDDVGEIIQNPDIRHFNTCLKALVTRERPTVRLTLAVNYALGGLNVSGYHFINLLIHLGAALVLYGLVRRILLSPPLHGRYQRSATGLALTVALLWVVHPLQTQAVTYIIQRGESLMSLCYLLTLYCVWRGAETGSWRWHGAAILVCALGMGAKEVMVTAPLLVLLQDRIFLASSWKQLFQHRWGVYAGLAATWVILGRRILEALQNIVPTSSPGLAAIAGPGSFMPVWIKPPTPLEYASTQPGVLLHYLQLTFWPLNLCLDNFNWPLARTWDEILPPLLVVSVLLAATLWALWRYPAWGFWGAWFFLILAPTSSIMPLFDLVVDHRMYLPLAAVIVLVVAGAHALLLQAPATARPWLSGGVVAVLVVLAGLTMQRNLIYRNNKTLWEDVVSKRPNNPRGHYNLGMYLARHGNKTEAKKHYEAALEILPNYPVAHVNLGLILMERGYVDEAIEHYRAALSGDPTNVGAHTNLGTALQKQGKLDEAQEHLEKAWQLSPNASDVLFNLAHLRIDQGRLDEAAQLYHRMLELDPQDVEALNFLGVVYLLQDKWDQAISCLRQVVQLVPKEIWCRFNLTIALYESGQEQQAMEQCQKLFQLYPEWPNYLYQESWKKATGSNAARGGKRAMHLARLACLGTEFSQPECLDALAAAYAAQRRFDEAVTTARKAAELADLNGWDQLAGQIKGRIKLYQKHQPFRESK